MGFLTTYHFLQKRDRQMGDMVCISKTKAGSKWAQTLTTSCMPLQVVA